MNKQEIEARRASVLERYGIKAAELTAQQAAERVQTQARKLTFEREDPAPVTAAKFLAELDRVSKHFGLRPDRDKLLAAAVSDGRVKLSDEEKLVDALAAKVAAKLGSK